jgi:FMN phosphatase YigB (HAD superfamily)
MSEFDRFDAIVTAEDVGSYKPQRGHFDRLFEGLDRLGVERDRLVHVAESLFHPSRKRRRRRNGYACR